ncbi:nuclease [Thermus sp. 2.9]|uniref:nuclease-related domain-containing protein n=1 Tax=Thermus sp. (strain 2.9) TaxID=1577051 RepID=UPI000542EF32|nr:nuclease-related domain-containing protein [Thermus sp. 2.9]KHG66515.1 nuclease [Thermus sp. 2.9]
MARQIGKAGKTLSKKLWRVAFVLLAFGFVAWLLVKLLVPWAGFLAFPLALLAVAKLLQDKEVERVVVASARGYLGEARVAQFLAQLPSTWRVFHDVDLGGENADHVVVGPPGVFNVEVKNYTGKIRATPRGLWIRGERRDDLVRQAWRQAHKLRELLGVEVEPLLVFVSGELEGRQVGRLPVLRPEEVVPYLKGLPPRLSFAQAQKVAELLEKRVK